jgi:hypothetical protein
MIRVGDLVTSDCAASAARRNNDVGIVVFVHMWKIRAYDIMWHNVTYKYYHADEITVIT